MIIVRFLSSSTECKPIFFFLTKSFFDPKAILILYSQLQNNLFHLTKILNLSFFFILSISLNVCKPIINFSGTHVWQSPHYRDETLNLFLTYLKIHPWIITYSFSSNFKVGLLFSRQDGSTKKTQIFFVF